MRLKTFRAFTLDEALDAVHDDLGEDAAILHTRTFRKGGLLGLGGREVVEVIASEAEPGSSILPAVSRGSEFGEPVTDSVPGGPATEKPTIEPTAEEASTPIGAGSLAGRAARLYGVEQARSSDSSLEPSTAPSEPVEPPPSSGTLEVDRDRTRALARAMEIRLERQQAARAAAGVTGPDDLVGDHADSTPSEPPISPPETNAETNAETTAETTATSPEVAAETFTIAPGGVLVPESRSEDGLADTPRVVELEVESIAPSTEGGIPTALPVESPAEPEPEPETEAETGPTVRDAEQELRQLGEVVGRVLDPKGPEGASRRTSPRAATAIPWPRRYAELIAQEFSKDLADRVVGALESRLDAETSRNHEVVRRIASRGDRGSSFRRRSRSRRWCRATVVRGRSRSSDRPESGRRPTLAKIAATLSIPRRTQGRDGDRRHLPHLRGGPAPDLCGDPRLPSRGRRRRRFDEDGPRELPGRGTPYSSTRPAAARTTRTRSRRASHDHGRRPAARDAPRALRHRLRAGAGPGGGGVRRPRPGSSRPHQARRSRGVRHARLGRATDRSSHQLGDHRPGRSPATSNGPREVESPTSSSRGAVKSVTDQAALLRNMVGSTAGDRAGEHRPGACRQRVQHASWSGQLRSGLRASRASGGSRAARPSHRGGERQGGGREVEHPRSTSRSPWRSRAGESRCSTPISAARTPTSSAGCR